MKIFKVISLFTVVLLLNACASIPKYERQYISDPEMQMGTDAGKGFNYYVNSIREGAILAESSKTSGGCGCN